MKETIPYLNLFGLGGLGVFIYYLVRGLKERIKALTELAEEQQKTLDMVRQRASEIKDLNQTYKQALADFEEMGKRLEERRQELIAEQDAAIARKDKELAQRTSLELKDIELKEESLRRIPELERKLEENVRALSKQLEIVEPTTTSTLGIPALAAASIDAAPAIIATARWFLHARNEYAHGLLSDAVKAKKDDDESQ